MLWSHLRGRISKNHSTTAASPFISKHEITYETESKGACIFCPPAVGNNIQVSVWGIPLLPSVLQFCRGPPSKPGIDWRFELAYQEAKRSESLHHWLRVMDGSTTFPGPCDWWRDRNRWQVHLIRAPVLLCNNLFLLGLQRAACLPGGRGALGRAYPETETQRR